jgi:hypothetical protein
MYAYTFIRRDLTIQQQLVQACHSALEAGSEFKKAGNIPNLILLDAKDEEHLNEIGTYLDTHEIRYHKFYEPDYNVGHSSITTEPLCAVKKKKLSNFKMWRA